MPDSGNVKGVCRTALATLGLLNTCYEWFIIFSRQRFPGGVLIPELPGPGTQLTGDS